MELGVPAPIKASKRWGVERSRVVDFYLYLATAIVTLRILIRRATPRYRWDTRTTTKRLK